MSMFQRAKSTVRPKAVRALDDALMTHYVRQEDVVRELSELRRVLTDRFDAESEAVAVLGQRLAALAAQMEQMQDELRSRR
jgi:hypothetical protein